MRWQISTVSLAMPESGRVNTTETIPIAMNTTAQVTQAGYSSLGGAKELVRKKNGFKYIGRRTSSGILYHPANATQLPDRAVRTLVEL